MLVPASQMDGLAFLAERAPDCGTDGVLRRDTGIVGPVEEECCEAQCKIVAGGALGKDMGLVRAMCQ